MTETGESQSVAETDDEQSERTRRELLASAAAIAGAGALGVYVGSSDVAAAPTGTFPESTDDPLLKIRADRVRLVERTSDPSSPNNGEMWYNSSA